MLLAPGYRERLLSARSRLAAAFSADTAAPGTARGTGSAGHCAVVALLVRASFGGELVAVTIGRSSHWFNRIVIDGRCFDVDLTGDQFGFEPVRMRVAGGLFGATRLRVTTEVREETFARAIRLAARSKFDSVEKLQTDLFC